jgi:high frequency lysogenization protein
LAKSLRDQVIALAGVTQAAQLVDQVARTGQADPQALEACVASLFEFDPPSTEAVFGGLPAIGYGMAALEQLLTPSQYSQVQVQAPARYLSGMLFLERQLSSREDLLDVIHSRLKHAAFNASHFSNDQAALMHAVAGIYQDTISKFKYRIQVTGDVQYLQNAAQADKIRSLLFAGIRAAILWRQVGGRRWHLLVRKSAIKHTVVQLRQELAH